MRHDDPKIIKIWYDQIRIIIRTNQQLIEKQREADSLKINQQYQRLKNVLEDIWREEILVRWENYWDCIKMRLRVRDMDNLFFSEKEQERFVERAEEWIHGIKNDELNSNQIQKIQNDLAKEVISYINQIWFEGIPDFSRATIWQLIA